MKKYILFLVVMGFSTLVSAQNAFIEIPQSYWETFNVENALQTANSGDADVQFMVALYYTDVAPDNGKFKYWIEKAGAQNHSGAQCLIAQCYAIGDYGFTQDKTKALEYARKSAMSNNIQAIGMMADIYRTGMFGLPKDDQLAAYWIGKGARLGDAYCQYMFGIMLLNGIGCLKNEQEGLLWLQKSADQKYIDAQCGLIAFYAQQKDDDKSRRKLMAIGLDFLINPEIAQNSESILFAKGLLGFEFFKRKNYRKGIQLMREGLKSQNELLQIYWQTMDEYAREVLGTTLYALENQ